MNLKGYVSVSIPVPVSVQNLVLRDYCQRNGHTLSLSDVEFVTDYKMLDALLANLDAFDGICAYSMWIMPTLGWQAPLLRVAKPIVFALENLQFPLDADSLQTMYRLRSATK